MNDRIQRVLDGEASREGLTAAELQELAEAEASIGSVLRSIPARPLPDLGPSVLRRLDALSPAAARVASPRPASVWQTVRAWLWSPRPISLQWRPAYAFAFAMLVVVGLSVRNATSTEPVTGAQQVLIQFRLDAPGAQQVALAGNFTGWKPEYQLTRSANGVWTVIVPLQEGVHKYAFVVDGETWQADPMAPSVSDGFGGQNSQIAVLSPDVIKES